MTVWIYTDARKQIGDKDHLKVFASEDAADVWFTENDPEGVAFKYDVIGPPPTLRFGPPAPTSAARSAHK